MNLTKNAISMISNSVDVVRPIVQVNDVRLVNTAQSATERYRMLLSDGDHQQQAMLATQLNNIVKEGKLMKGSIVQLNEFICNVIQGRRIIIVISLDVLVDNVDPIGDPKNFDNSSVSPQSRTSMPVSSSIPDHQQQQQNMRPSNPQPYVNRPHSTGPIAQQNTMMGISVSTRPSYNGTTNANPGMSVGNDSYVNGGAQNQRYSNTSNTSNTAYRPPGNPYVRPGQQMYQPPPPTYTNRGPISINEAPARIVPISALNPYQSRWTIKARVTSKAEMHRYNNARGDGKVFSFDLLDSEGGEIRATCFNQVAEQFYDKIEAGHVYMISKGSLKPAKKDFNHLNNEYEITLELTSTILPCPEEDSSIPKQQFKFRPIIEIEGMENNSMLDLIGIVSSITPTGSIMKKNGQETHKRTLQLKDMSGRSVELTLWGNFCTNEGQQLQELCDSGNFPVLAVKAGRVSDFSGKSVGTISSSQLFINPDYPEAHKLMDWFSREGKSIPAPSISRDSSQMGKTDTRKTVVQIKDEGLGRSEKPDWVTVKATVSFIKTDAFCYTACPLTVGDRQCSKKVINNGDGTWHCERCDQSVPECDYRYLVSFQIQDHTGMTWVTAFQETGEEIFGAPARKLHHLKNEEQDEAKFSEIVRSVLFHQYLFKLKVKEETYSDEQRVKVTAVKAVKSVMSPGHSSGQVLNGSANPAVLQQAQVRSQQFSGLTQDIKPEINPLLSARAAVSEASLIRAPGSNHVTLKGWPLAAGDQVRSGAIQNPLHLLSPQQQLLFQNNGNIDSHRLRMLIENNKSTGDMILNAGSPGQNSSLGHVDSELIKKITQMQQQQNQFNSQQLQRQSSNQPLSQHDKNDSLRGDDQGQNSLTQHERKRKQHGSSSGPANSSGTANTVGPVPSSAPSTPSTHTPGDVISLPALQPADIDRFGEERALNDIDSFLSHDDTDIRETAKGFTFGEIASTGASTNKVVCCHFSVDGKLLVTGGHDKKAVLWNTDSLKQVFSLNEHTMLVTDVRFSPSMARLATSSFDKNVRVWDVKNPGFTLRNFMGHSASVRSLDFHPNMEDLICSSDDDGEIRYWSIKNGSCTTVFKGATNQIRFQPRSGRYLAAAAEKNVNIIDSETQTCLRSLQGHQQNLTSICWDPSGQYIASASEDLIRVWSIGSRNESDFMHELNCTGNKFYSCAFHPTHSSVLIIGCYQSILLWDMLENKTMTVPAHEGLVASLAVSNANGLVASASYDKVVKLWK